MIEHARNVVDDATAIDFEGYLRRWTSMLAGVIAG